MAVEYPKIKIAIFISGRGSNMQALIDSCAKPDFLASIALVLSNRPDAPGLEKARAAGLNTAIVDHKAYAGREAFEDALHTEVEKYNVDLICLAGFMRILTPDFINRWEGRVINIHPSLLPKYKGLNTHQRALDAGDLEVGCTVHYVVPDVDSGEIIVQKSAPVLPGDTAETLAARVLEQEHIAYPQAVKIVAEKILDDRNAA